MTSEEKIIQYVTNRSGSIIFIQNIARYVGITEEETLKLFHKLIRENKMQITHQVPLRGVNNKDNFHPFNFHVIDNFQSSVN